MSTKKSAGLSLAPKLAASGYIFFIIAVALFAYRQGFSSYYADQAKSTQSHEYIAKAVQIDASNPDSFKVDGMLRFKTGDHAQAAEMLEKALRLKNDDYMLWLRFGFAHQKLGNYDEALRAYRRSVEIAPGYAQPNRYLGRLLLDLGRAEESFEFLRRAAEFDEELYPEVLHLARKQHPSDGAAIEKLIAPANLEAEKKLAFYLVKHSLATDRTRDFLTGGALTDTEKTEFAKALIAQNEFQFARRVWVSQKSRSASAGASADTLIFDGGFETTTNSDETGFGWQVNSKLTDAAVSIDTTVQPNGGNAIRFVLNGKTDFNLNLLAQTVLVEPSKNYTLEFDLLSAPVTSYGGVNVVVADRSTGKILAQSAPFKDTAGKWEQRRLDFQTAAAEPVVIAVRRTACAASPCPIFADFRIDNFALRQK